MSITVTREYYDFNDLKENSWSGAREWLEEVSLYNLEDVFMAWLEDIFAGTQPTETAVNDVIWFETAEWLEEVLSEQTSEYENILNYMNFKGMNTDDLEGAEGLEAIIGEFNTVGDFVEEYETYDNFEDMKKAMEGEE